MKLRQLFVVGFVPLIFFILSVATLSDYGINWDEPIHFNRGQGYLYLFLTGKTEFDEPISQNPSFFYGYEPKALFDWDGGHPPTSDIIAAFFNLVFYQKLGILGDINSYHLFNILSASLLVFVVAFFAYRVYGIFASVVAATTLSIYPLFFAESHFNIKDPPEAAFFGLSILAFWLSLKKGSWRWLLLSSVGVGIALGTKLNIVFLPLILLPYLLIRYFPIVKQGPSKIVVSLQKVPVPYWRMLALMPFIAVAIFFVTWPYLWQNPVANFLEIVRYYKEIGTGFDYQPSGYMFGGFNLYPIFWIFVTTPPWILFLTSIGGVMAVLRNDREKSTFLWLLWFFVPIIRVSLPGTSVYGGIRQIMEFLPAMALLSGLGAYYLRKWLMVVLSRLEMGNPTGVFSVLLVAAFIPHLIIMARLHPNQNVYFNSFVGGLSGAKEKDIPSWGNSYGNAYWQAIRWINENAEESAKLALVQGTGQNIPLIQLRKDIEFSNTNWSGINRDGEYLMELVYQGSVKAYPYAWDYIEIFLEPVYKVEVDGVVIAKVWKNDLEHTKPEWKKKESVYEGSLSLSKKQKMLSINLGERVFLSRLVFYKPHTGCKLDKARLEASVNGLTWGKEPEGLSTPQVIELFNFGENSINFYFPAREVKFLKIIAEDEESCFLQSAIDLLILEDD